VKKDNLNSLALKFVIFALIILMLTRIVIFFSYGNNFDLTELLNAFWLGFRFDLKLISTVLLPLYIVWILTLKRLSYKFFDYFLLLILLIITTFSFVNFGYYKFFGNEFDTLFLGIINDGTNEVVKSIVSVDFLVVLILLIVVFLVFITYLWKRVKIKIVNESILFYIVTIIILAFFARGSLGTFPLGKKTINSVDNTFLSNALFNPIWQLYYAYEDLKLNRLTTPEKVLKRYKLNSYQELYKKAGFNEKNPLKSTTKKDDFLEQNRPNIIFVLMESWSSYIALFNNKENNVLGNFAKHAQDDYIFYRFFSNGYGTNPTIEELLLNSPVKDLSQSKGKNTKFSLFTLNPFIQNGYKSIFLSGGSSSWRNHNRFWKTQGFDSYIGRASIENYFNTTCNNTWGVYDELLFKYLKEVIFQKSNKPFFAFVLTTNNHPPVELPKSFKMPKIDLSYYGLSNDNTNKKIRLGAYNYQTNVLGDFLTWLKDSKYKDNTIVVATGDHIIKGFKDYALPKEQFYKYGVPLYLYIPKKFDKLKSIDKNIVGSHNDIFPTLYNLALSNTSYYSFGTSLMQKNIDSFGWNEQDQYIFYNGVSDTKHLYSWDNNLTLNSKDKILDEQKLEKIKKQRYKNILIEYLLNLEFKNSK
jgi:phosphoglycerol transferase MdoB-like AlkP superfamily enzyme